MVFGHLLRASIMEVIATVAIDQTHKVARAEGVVLLKGVWVVEVQV